MSSHCPFCQAANSSKTTLTGAPVLLPCATPCHPCKKSSLEAVRDGQFWRAAQYLLLLQLDNGWATHLRAMNYLKESVVLRKYQGRDVLQEYVIEGARLYEDLLATARRNTVYSLMVYNPKPTEGSK